MKEHKCAACQGKGWVSVDIGNGLDQLTCNYCKGKGYSMASELTQDQFEYRRKLVLAMVSSHFNDPDRTCLDMKRALRYHQQAENVIAAEELSK